MTVRPAAIAAIIGIAAVVILLAVYAVRVERPGASPSPTVAAVGTATAGPTSTTSPVLRTTAPPTAPAATPAPAGAITGALGFPSSSIPPLTVYAISVTDARVWFSVETPRYPLPTNTPPKPSYTVTGVVPGTYYVLAYPNDDSVARDRPGVYSEYVRCGGAASCMDHRLVPVTIRSGETVSGIDVIDWYYPQGTTYPARPR